MTNIIRIRTRDGTQYRGQQVEARSVVAECMGRSGERSDVGPDGDRDG